LINPKGKPTMTRLALLALAASLVLAPLPLHAADSVTVENAWARPAAGGRTSVVYLTMKSAEPDRLVAAATPVAGKATLHTSMNESGIIRMRPVEGIPLEPGQPTTLQPGGLHIMLEQLKQPLKEGDHIPLTLTFEKSGTKQVEVAVAKAGAHRPTGGHEGATRPGP
jgi:copper(I)-binding protein